MTPVSSMRLLVVSSSAPEDSIDLAGGRVLEDERPATRPGVAAAGAVREQPHRLSSVRPASCPMQQPSLSDARPSWSHGDCRIVRSVDCEAIGPMPDLSISARRRPGRPGR